MEKKGKDYEKLCSTKKANSEPKPVHPGCKRLLLQYLASKLRDAGKRFGPENLSTDATKVLHHITL